MAPQTDTVALPDLQRQRADVVAQMQDAKHSSRTLPGDIGAVLAQLNREDALTAELSSIDDRIRTLSTDSEIAAEVESVEPPEPTNIDPEQDAEIASTKEHLVERLIGEGVSAIAAKQLLDAATFWYDDSRRNPVMGMTCVLGVLELDDLRDVNDAVAMLLTMHRSRLLPKLEKRSTRSTNVARV